MRQLYFYISATKESEFFNYLLKDRDLKIYVPFVKEMNKCVVHHFDMGVIDERRYYLVENCYKYESYYRLDERSPYGKGYYFDITQCHANNVCLSKTVPVVQYERIEIYSINNDQDQSYVLARLFVYLPSYGKIEPHNYRNVYSIASKWVKSNATSKEKFFPKTIYWIM